MNLEIETIRTIDLLSSFNTELVKALHKNTLLDSKKTGALVAVINTLSVMCSSVCDMEKMVALHALRLENEMLLKECSTTKLFVHHN